MMHPSLSPELRSYNNEKKVVERRACLPNVSVRPNRVVATIAGIQVMRALWQIWDAIDNDRPGSINDIIIPTVYISCILSIILMITSATATWSVYKLRTYALNVCWWLFYILTIFSFLNNCTSLSIICLGKKDFIGGCLTETEDVQREGCGKMASEEDIVGTEYDALDMKECHEALSLPNFQGCHQLWEDSVIWSAVTTMVDLLINLGFAYALYKCRVRSRLDERNSNFERLSENQIHPGARRSPPPYSDEGSSSDTSNSDDFKTLRFK